VPRPTRPMGPASPSAACRGDRTPVTAGRTVRLPAVAGLFYPDDPNQLRERVNTVMAEAIRHLAPDGREAKAVIAPHAGYVYSGPIAASAYARLAAGRG